MIDGRSTKFSRHITLTNHYLMIVIRRYTAKAIKRHEAGSAIAPGQSDLAMLDDIGRHGAFRWIRPAHMERSGQQSSGEVRSLFARQMQECLDLLASMQHGEGSFAQVRMSVNESGKLDMYQWLYFLAQHALRHVTQMRNNTEILGAHNSAAHEADTNE